MDWIITEEDQLPKMENDFLKSTEGKVVFIAGEKSLLVPVWWRYQIMRLLNTRSGFSTNR